MLTQRKYSIELLLALALFAVYTASALLLCVLGANIYRQTVADMQADYNDRTGVLYIAEKIRQNDVGGSLRLDTLNGEPALVLVEQETGRNYETWIFIWEGKLCEQFIAGGSEPILPAAQPIMPAQSLGLELSNSGLLSVNLVNDQGESSVIELATRSSGGSFNTSGTPSLETPPATSDDAAASGPTIMTPAPSTAAFGVVTGWPDLRALQGRPL